MPTPKFIKKTKDKNSVFKVWSERVNRIEQLMGDGEDINKTFEIAYQLFPLLDSISYNLFNSDAHAYLQDMGLSPTEAAVLIDVFRNGFIHNFDSYNLEYADGKIIWSVFSSGGTGGLRPFDFGYEDKEDPTYNLEGDKVIEYEDMGNNVSLATLDLDRLLARIKVDLEARQKEYPHSTIDFIVGQKMPGKKPKHKPIS